MPADLGNADFRELIAKDPGLTKAEKEGKKLDETIRLLGDSPATFVFSDKNPVRGLVLDALKEENPKLAKLMALDNRFGRHYADGGGKDISARMVVAGQTGQQRASGGAR